ncbi:hypothetical protein BXY75_0039 [Ulvibacter antarcticus]|uniref:Uncharacterized protein n=2 Tax=Ulvibacter antarcticus TaxID=442714 RepID=A0A3L9Z4D3_9FLAO|nr:hypothetical protein BXY75_0039 [Ulvibacter antarcticus]
MTFLPIQFRTKIKFSDYEKLNKSDILDKIENYLELKNYNYVVRKENSIVFHKSNAWTSFDFKSFLVSGIVKLKERKDGFVIISGNWMVFLIAIPFILILLLSKSDYSTLDVNDIQIIEYSFATLFGVNMIIRFFAHLIFKYKIKDLIKN